MAIIATAIASLTNCARIAFAIVNVPSRVGWYDRHSNIRYGAEPRQSLDVYAPVGAFNRPVVVFWYGGIWTKGTKEQYRFVGAALANAGYVAILPDYRLYPQVHFPAFVEDGALAVKWAHEHAAEFGGSPRTLFIMGHSAGAHIAASVALDPRHLRKVGGDPAWVRGWIGVAGPYGIEPSIPFLRAIFPKPYTAADWQPMSLVKARAPPALILHGLNDGMVRPTEAVAFDGKLRAAGVPVECHIYPDVGHFDIVSAFSVALRGSANSLQDVTRFIERVMGLPGPGGAVTIYHPCPSLIPYRDSAQSSVG